MRIRSSLIAAWTVALTATVALAANILTFSEHPSITSNNQQLTVCATVTGVGNEDLTVVVTSTATTTCTNKGQNVPGGLTETVSGHGVEHLHPENGRASFCVTTRPGQQPVSGRHASVDLVLERAHPGLSGRQARPAADLLASTKRRLGTPPPRRPSGPREVAPTPAPLTPRSCPSTSSRCPNECGSYDRRAPRSWRCSSVRFPRSRRRRGSSPSRCNRPSRSRSRARRARRWRGIATAPPTGSGACSGRCSTRP